MGKRSSGSTTFISLLGIASSGVLVPSRMKFSFSLPLSPSGRCESGVRSKGSNTVSVLLPEDAGADCGEEEVVRI